MTIKVHHLRPAPGSHTKKQRVGRGPGSKGKTAGRGTKGQRARNTVARGFEGGQMPLKQRIPKLKGFTNPFRVEYHAVNLDTLQEIADAGTSTIDAAVLAGNGPCNRERLADRREAHADGAWVREAALAHAAKRRTRLAA